MTQLKKLIPVPGSEEAYKEIELTDAEIAEAMMLARQKKSAEIKRQEYAKKVFKEKIYVYPTAEQLREKYLSLGNVLDEYNTEVFENLLLYFTDHEDCKLNKEKGLFLFGGVGVGKSSMMDFFKFNKKSSFIITSCRNVTYQYAENGHESINRYKGLIKFSDIDLSYGQRELGVCFDDLGTEVDKKNWGNLSNVMADIFLNRYDNLSNLKAKTHITSNLTIVELEERYGTRVRSRLREMFNLIEFDSKSPDRRK